MMMHAPIRRRVWLLLMVIGFTLMNVALFLHPMNPTDFLNIASSDPWQSIVDAQGGGMAMFFWVSAIFTAFCALRFLIPASILQRLAHPSKSMTRLAH